MHAPPPMLNLVVIRSPDPEHYTSSVGAHVFEIYPRGRRAVMKDLDGHTIELIEAID